MFVEHFREQLGAHGRRFFGRRRRGRRAQVRRMIDQGRVRLMTDRGDERDRARRSRAHDNFLIEAPEVFKAAAAARHDENIRTRNIAAFRQRVEAFNGGGDLRFGAFSLHKRRPDDHMTRKPFAQAMKDIANDSAGRRRDDADHVRQEGNRTPSRRIEQPFGGEFFAPLFEDRHQRADAGGLKTVDDDLVFRLPGESCELAGRHNFHSLFGRNSQSLRVSLPDDAGNRRVFVLQVEIHVAGRRASDAAKLALDANKSEAVFNDALYGAREFAD